MVVGGSGFRVWGFRVLGFGGCRRSSLGLRLHRDLSPGSGDLVSGRKTSSAVGMNVVVKLSKLDDIVLLR